MSKTAAQVLLTTAHIRSWEAEGSRLDKQIAELTERREKIKQKLAYASALIEDVDEVPVQKVPRNSRSARLARAIRKGKRQATPTWMTEITRALTGALNGMDYPALKAAIATGPLGPRLAASDKGFYGAIAKLKSAETIVAYGRRVFMRELFEAYQRRVAEGEIEETYLDVPNRPSPMGDAILTFVTAHPLGARSGDIVNEMLRYPQFSETVSRNRTAAYNVIRRLVDRKAIRKIGDKYYPPITNEPQEEQSSHGPYAGGVPADINANSPARAH